MTPDRHVPADRRRFTRVELYRAGGFGAIAAARLLHRTNDDWTWESILQAKGVDPGWVNELAAPRPTSRDARALGCTCVQINDGVPTGEWRADGGMRLNFGWAVARDCVLHGALLDAELDAKGVKP